MRHVLLVSTCVPVIGVASSVEPAQASASAALAAVAWVVGTIASHAAALRPDGRPDTALDVALILAAAGALAVWLATGGGPVDATTFRPPLLPAVIACGVALAWTVAAWREAGRATVPLWTVSATIGPFGCAYFLAYAVMPTVDAAVGLLPSVAGPVDVAAAVAEAMTAAAWFTGHWAAAVLLAGTLGVRGSPVAFRRWT